MSEIFLGFDCNAHAMKYYFDMFRHSETKFNKMFHQLTLRGKGNDHS